jgi:hypothetical protein
MRKKHFLLDKRAHACYTEFDILRREKKMNKKENTVYEILQQLEEAREGVLSKNYSLYDCIYSNVAIVKAIKEQFTPPEPVIKNLKEVCENILEPVVERYGMRPIIASGYRCGAVNNELGRNRKSPHLSGVAVDISFKCKEANRNLFDYVKNELNFTRLIYYYADGGLPSISDSPSYIHVSYEPENLAKEVLYCELVSDDIPGSYTKKYFKEA